MTLRTKEHKEAYDEVPKSWGEKPLIEKVVFVERKDKDGTTSGNAIWLSDLIHDIKRLKEYEGLVLNSLIIKEIFGDLK